MHNELQIRVQHFSHNDFCISPPGGIDMFKNWKKSKYHHSVHNLHAQWIANLWQIVKSIRVKHFSHIDFSICHQGAATSLKIGRNYIIVPVDNLAYIHNELQSCSNSWNVSGYFISVILISVFDHQGASICLKIGKKSIYHHSCS